jgi:hypothetical protein
MKHDHDDQERPIFRKECPFSVHTTCRRTTITSNQIKLPFKGDDAQTGAKLTKASGTQNACQSHTNTRGKGGPIDADTLFQDDDPHHQAADRTLRTRVNGENRHRSGE